MAGSQFQRAQNYINEYTTANNQLSQASNILLNTLQNVLNMTSVRQFLSDINEHLNNNVQQLTTQYSPVNIQSYILSFLPTFLVNLATNNGSESQVLELNLFYFSKILLPNVTDCMSTYNSKHFQIYSNAVSNFTQLLKTETSSTGDELDTLRNEIKAMVTSLVGTLENIIINPLSARQLFDNFVRKEKFI